MRRFFLLVLLTSFVTTSARADRVDDLGRVLANDSNWKVRMQAASVLGRLRDKRGVSSLVRALTDASESVRGVAAGALGEIGDPSSVAALRRALRDPSSLVRDQAQVALESLHAGTPPTAETVPPAPRGGAKVEIGAITSRTSRLPGDLAERLRKAITRNLSRTPGAALSTAPEASGYVLDTSVTKLTRRVGEDAVEIDCEVSLLLSRMPSKAIVLTTSAGATSRAGRATYQPDQDSGLIVDALDGAVNGAWANLAAYFSKTSAKR